MTRATTRRDVTSMHNIAASDTSILLLRRYETSLEDFRQRNALNINNTSFISMLIKSVQSHVIQSKDSHLDIVSYRVCSFPMRLDSHNPEWRFWVSEKLARYECKFQIRRYYAYQVLRHSWLSSHKFFGYQRADSIPPSFDTHSTLALIHRSSILILHKEGRHCRNFTSFRICNPTPTLIRNLHL